MISRTASVTVGLALLTAIGLYANGLLGDAMLGFVVAAGVSLFRMQPPVTPSFASGRTISASIGQLRQDLNATFLYDYRGFLFRKRLFFVGTGCPPVRLTGQQLAQLNVGQWNRPMKVTSSASRTWWWFEGAIYWDSCGYNSPDVFALVADRKRRQETRLERAHTLSQAEQSRRVNGCGPSRQRRGPLLQAMRRVVFERDSGRCLQCGTTFPPAAHACKSVPRLPRLSPTRGFRRVSDRYDLGRQHHGVLTKS